MPRAIVALRSEGPEDRREPDREDEERKREQDVREPRDHGIDPTSVIAGDEADRHCDDDREHGRQHAGHDRRARAPDDPREDVAPELVGAKEVLPRAVSENQVEVAVVRRVWSDPRRECRDRDERQRDDQADDGDRPAQEALAQQPPPARATGQLDRDRRLDVAHERVPATRMRGFKTEYRRSTVRLTKT